MDELDIKIIKLLKSNSRMTGSEIGKRINLSVPAVAERMRKLEDGGIISQYTIKIDRDKLDRGLMAFIFATIEKTEHIKGFREAIKSEEAVLECHHIAGEYDYLLKVVVKNTSDLEEFISNKLKKTAGVTRTNTIIALSSIKEEV
ncbi:HTH-type transcriptional regulator LrpC [Oxobacter pfennigii]|uniref:HTH-type transcriptional regulator LrpC n=1 Tax=Oxobacter pfennigii TaxID=36849 RepID=A0A0P8WBK5_9CLOT|nr:Lrp/AsnC family transcriptional regulator [Oxobacter pfennigii]KPU45306.1 HTH-type transcriptional regulator LrpC [Oxobacter pfennigii]